MDKIYIIEDDENIRNLLKIALEGFGYEAEGFETAEEGLIDYYVYQMKASKSKLDFLVQKAKKRGISLDMIEELYFRKNQVG